MVNPATTTGDVALLPVSLPGLQVAVYWVIAAPPLLRGGEKAMLALPWPAGANPMIGASGGVTSAGVTWTSAEAVLLPATLCAVTEQL